MKEKTTLVKIFFSIFVVVSTLTVQAYSQEVAPDFTLTDIDGNKFSLSDYRGKIVLLDFFFIR